MHDITYYKHNGKIDWKSYTRDRNALREPVYKKFKPLFDLIDDTRARSAVYNIHDYLGIDNIEDLAKCPDKQLMAKVPNCGMHSIRIIRKALEELGIGYRYIDMDAPPKWIDDQVIEWQGKRFRLEQGN